MPSAFELNLKNYSFHKSTFQISFVLQKGVLVAAQSEAEGIWVSLILSVIAVRATAASNDGMLEKAKGLGIGRGQMNLKTEARVRRYWVGIGKGPFRDILDILKLLS